MLVEHILENDEKVFEQLLTTERFFVYHSGDNKAMDAGAKQLKKVYQKFRNLDWQTWEPEDIAPHREFLMTIWEFRKARGGDNKALLTTLKRMMPALESHFSGGQSNGMPYMKMAMGFWHGGNVLGRTGQQMRGEQVTSYWNLDWKTWDYPTQQPAPIPNRKGLLTHPAWLIAHSQNLETDPIHRGKWIREKLLAGTIPDVPITVDAVIPFITEHSVSGWKNGRAMPIVGDATRKWILSDSHSKALMTLADSAPRKVWNIQTI